MCLTKSESDYAFQAKSIYDFIGSAVMHVIWPNDS